MKTLLLGAVVHPPGTHMIRNMLLSVFLVVASAAYAGAPMNVTVFDSGGRVAFKGATNVDRTFVTENLPPGKYVVQFTAKSVAMNGNQYLVVVSAGRKKVIADAVAGEKFAAGGIAMRVDVGTGLKITGQVVSGQTIVSSASITVRVINGKRYVWIGSELGSNLGGHWEEEGMASAQNIKNISMADFRKIQDRSFEGSLLNRHGLAPAHAQGGY
ncbi:MAG: hypothetical protein DLM73_09055 [Chthoniobacterales bacterium]|nr:MAG: hypothetical protein DLM73_09055 [Chthoniobacterales bacterium]